MATDFIYDNECYPNIFHVTLKQAGESMLRRFEISSRRNDYASLIYFLRYLKEAKARMVGYNNVGYDWPVINYIMEHPNCTPASIYLFSCSIIRKQEDEDNSIGRYSHIIWNPIIPQIDLYKIHHFDNKAKRTSLKALEFNMRSESVEDLPFPPGTFLHPWQMDMLIQYNDHDVDETEAFYFRSLDMIHFREELSAKYRRNFLNHNDTKIGKDYMASEIERLVPGACYVPGTKKPRQTIRECIRIGDVIFPYVQFSRPQFTAVRDWMAQQVITRDQFDELGKESDDGKLQTKGFFTKIPVDQLGTLAQYAELKTVKGNKNRPTVTIATHLNTVVQPAAGESFKFVFGTGGIHGSVSSRTIRSTDTHVIKDIDVESLYPSLGIVNRLYPAHLGEIFCDIYADVKRQRVSFKKGSPENGMLKLALNGVYGDSNNKYSVFYDPQYTMSITINGQLLLCMLADYLMYIPGLEMIQINTDGITMRLPRTQESVFNDVCSWWQEVTRLKLEEVEYSRMWIGDVNNYLAEKMDGGKIKRKGRFAWKFDHKTGKNDKGMGDLDWHQDHSALVIPRAVEEYLVHGTPIAQFIWQHSDPFDFMLRAKVNRKSRLVMGDRQVQNITRYYISNSGASLVKIMPELASKPGSGERHIGIDVGWLVTECNRVPVDGLTDINYDYYISEAEKLAAPLLREY